jgi:hypothetical protein
MSATAEATRQLSADDRARLIRILGMLGSDFAGERDAAARAAAKLLASRGLGWAEVIQPAAPRTQAPPPPPPADWRRDVDHCLNNLDAISPYELWFCLGLARGTNPITSERLERLAAMMDRLRAAGRTV